MKLLPSALVLATSLAASLAAAPAFAGAAGFDLPRLEFPAPSADVAGQGCAAPAHVAGQPCGKPRS